MELSRRQLLSAAGTAGVVAGSAVLTGCGFSKSGSGSSGSSSDALTFTTWGTDAELAGFKSAITGFEAANKGATVKLNAVPYAEMFTNIDAQLQAGNPPDIFRVPYYTFGSYAGAGQLLDLSSHLPSGFSSRFTEAAWAAVQGDGKPYGVPHHTDTSVIYYSKAAMSAAGITSVPTSLSDAWSWEEFAQVMQKLRAKLPAKKYPFAANWQGNGVTRWLTWLFEADGAFLGADGKTPKIDSAAGTAAVDFTKSFFTKKWVPANNSVKSTTYAQDTWYAQTAALSLGGGFQVPDAQSNLKFDWGCTFAPRDKRAASDFGGNALVATAATKKADLAGEFLAYITGQQQMRNFCSKASLLPTRRDLVASGIKFAVRPELTPIFLGQASTVQAADAAQVASPDMSKIIVVLQNGLEQAFVGGQSTSATLKQLSSGIGKATG